MSQDSPTLLWEPSAERKAQANLTRFIGEVNTRWQAGCTDHASLYAWSVREPVTAPPRLALGSFTTLEVVTPGCRARSAVGESRIWTGNSCIR